MGRAVCAKGVELVAGEARPEQEVFENLALAPYTMGDLKQNVTTLSQKCKHNTLCQNPPTVWKKASIWVPMTQT